MKRNNRLPRDLSAVGVAAVDILVNGSAMLIIVIMPSIAARTEHEEPTSALRVNRET